MPTKQQVIEELNSVNETIDNVVEELYKGEVNELELVNEVYASLNNAMLYIDKRLRELEAINKQTK